MARVLVEFFSYIFYLLDTFVYFFLLASSSALSLAFFARTPTKRTSVLAYNEQYYFFISNCKTANK